MKRISFDPIQGFINLVLVAFGIIILYPFYYTFMVSICEYRDILEGGILIFPKKISFLSYSLIFELTDIGRAFFASVGVTVIGTLVNLFVSITGAYVLSKKRLPGHRFFLLLLIIAMLFQGGLIPYYLTVKKIGLMNSFFVMIFPVAVNFFYLFILINYFKQVPPSLEESAYLDGANDIVVLIRIILPISIPTLSAVGLFYTVDRWNEWWHAMIFLTDDFFKPLQLILRSLLVSIEVMMTDSMSSGALDRFDSIFTPGLKMASVVITTIPILLVYPFLQKHFSKGIMMGSIKG